MAAKDVFHNVVKTALQKDGWVITDDPLTLRVDAFTDLFIFSPGTLPLYPLSLAGDERR
jgi:hypothetical protein